LQEYLRGLESRIQELEREVAELRQSAPVPDEEPVGEEMLTVLNGEGASLLAERRESVVGPTPFPVPHEP
jgi:hypothetical protein